MVNALKKRYKRGDTVTLYTNEFSFTGKIVDFENACIVLDTNDNIEFVANSSILSPTNRGAPYISHLKI
jgi:hypothetical protein